MIHVSRVLSESSTFILMKTIDINCDMGESFGRHQIGNDEAIFPYISSCNIACGFHGGDPFHIERTIKWALKHNVRIGAHPSYPDLAGFGRRKMQVPPSELKAIIKYQIAAVKGLVESQGGKLEYVKPHGALYNTAASSETESRIIIEAVRAMGSKLALMGLAGSITEQVAKREGIPFIAEAFADRAYDSDGKLRSRSKEGAVHHDPQKVVEQVLSIATENKVMSYDGGEVSLQADSICIHGDNPAAVAILQALDEAFQQHQILKQAGAK